MESQNDPTPPEQPVSADPPQSPRKRFRIEKVEERIAPGGHYNPHSKWVGDGNGGGDSSTTDTIVVSIY